MVEKKLKHLLFDDVFRHLDKMMATMGLHKIYQPENRLTEFRIFQWTLCAISASNLTLLLIGMIIFVFKAESSFEILEVMPNIFYIITALVKLATLVVRRNLIYELTNDLKSLWPRANDDNAVKRFNKNVVPTLKLCIFYSSITIGPAFIEGVTPIFITVMNYLKFGEFHMKKSLLSWYPFDYEKSVLRLLFVSVTQFWAGCTAGCLMCIGDNFMCMLISLLLYNFETISDSLKAIQPTLSDIGDYGVIETKENEDNIILYNCEDIKEANARLKNCIIYHCRLLRLCQLLEDIFSFAMFANLSISAITLCEILFNVLVVPPDKLHLYVVFIVSVTFQVFMLCWYSDKLLRQSSELTSAAYHCGWYNADRTFRMNIIQLQLRTQKPVALTAMKFVILSINTFLNIVASAWSYFTLLRQLYGK